MQVYDYKGKTKIYLCGDIHEDFKKLFFNLKGKITHDSNMLIQKHPYKIEEDEEYSQSIGRYRMEDIGVPNFLSSISVEDGLVRRRGGKNKELLYDNALLICTGDCGFGIKSLEYYMGMLSRLNEILAKNNCTLLMIRGNIDNPQYFDGKTINFSHIKAIPDYSVILTKKHNILCIGGGISIDRSWKKGHEKRLGGKTLYWENEAPILDHDKLNEIFQSGIQINGVVSHSAPTSVPVNNDNGLKYWVEKDASLEKDVQNERNILEELFSILKKNKEDIVWWAFGHFHYHAYHMIDKTNFFSIPDSAYIASLEHELEKTKRVKLKMPNISSFMRWDVTYDPPRPHEEAAQVEIAPLEIVEDGPMDIARAEF